MANDQQVVGGGYGIERLLGVRQAGIAHRANLSTLRRKNPRLKNEVRVEQLRRPVSNCGRCFDPVYHRARLVRRFRLSRARAWADRHHRACGCHW